NLYRFWPQGEPFKRVWFTSDSDADLFRANGRAFGPHWKPPALQFSIDSNAALDSDFPLFHLSVPLLSERALLATESLIGNSAEIFPVLISGCNYYLLNVVDVVDCLDKATSDFSVNPIAKLITSIHRYSFNDSCVDRNIFKILESAW